MKKTIILLFIVTIFLSAQPAFADNADINKVQSFVQSVIQLMVTLAGLVASGFFVVGGFRYITSSGNPLQLEKAKKTILYSAIGLVIVLGAFVFSNIVTNLGTQAFGK